jgi:hypothetical protein
MTTGEKAKELIQLFYNNQCSHSITELAYKSAKECALACVDEIISIPSIQAAYAQGYSHSKSTESYWREVKQEIIKL